MAEVQSINMPEKRVQSSVRQPPAYLWWLTMSIVVLIFLGLIILWQSGYFSLPGQAVRIMGRKHYMQGDVLYYNSKPPTSGLHYADRMADWGIHYEKLDELLQVSNLERGGIIINYKPRGNPVLPDADRDALEKLIKRLRSEPKYCKLILARWGDLDKKIALTAWGRIDKMDAYDEARIMRFVDAYINKGPETIPCQ